MKGETKAAAVQSLSEHVGYWGDNLARAKIASRSHPLDSEWGESGKTLGEIIAGYERGLAKAQAALADMEAQPARAFTLVELLVVLALVALLIGLLLPAVAGSRETARSAKCRSQLRSVTEAEHAYLASYGRISRSVDDLDLEPGAGTTCPADPLKRDWSYVWSVPTVTFGGPQLRDDSVLDWANWSGYELLGDKVDFRHGKRPQSWRNAGYLDGHAGQDGPLSGDLCLWCAGMR